MTCDQCGRTTSTADGGLLRGVPGSERWCPDCLGTFADEKRRCQEMQDRARCKAAGWTEHNFPKSTVDWRCPGFGGWNEHWTSPSEPSWSSSDHTPPMTMQPCTTCLLARLDAQEAEAKPVLCGWGACGDPETVATEYPSRVYGFPEPRRVCSRHTITAENNPSRVVRRCSDSPPKVAHEEKPIAEAPDTGSGVPTGYACGVCGKQLYELERLGHDGKGICHEWCEPKKADEKPVGRVVSVVDATHVVVQLPGDLTEVEIEILQVGDDAARRKIQSTEPPARHPSRGKGWGARFTL